MKKVALWLVIAVFAGCDGSTDVAKVGSGGTGVADGVVTGFGSVVINGTAYTDSGISHVVEDETGQKQSTVAQLGQRVQLAFDESHTATNLQVLPQLRGTVTAVAKDGSTITVLSQKVMVVTDANNAWQSTLTISGFDATPAVGDAIEVHGDWVLDNGAYILVASRLDKLDSAPTPVLISGVVIGLDATANTFYLNSGTGLKFSRDSHAPTSLANGQVVQFWVDQAKLSSTPIQIHHWRGQLETPTILGGLVTQYHNGVAYIQGWPVQLSNPDSDVLGALQKGQFLQLSGLDQGKPDKVALRNPSADDNFGMTTTLQSVIQGVDWAQNPVLFGTRGVKVSARHDRTVSCPVPPMPPPPNTELIQIQIKGRFEPGTMRLIATELVCTPPPAMPHSNQVYEYTGMVSSIDLVARTMTLEGFDFTAVWDDKTVIVKGSFQKIDAKTVSLTLEGMLTLEGGRKTLRLRKVTVNTAKSSESKS